MGGGGQSGSVAKRVTLPIFIKLSKWNVHQDFPVLQYANKWNRHGRPNTSYTVRKIQDHEWLSSFPGPPGSAVDVQCARIAERPEKCICIEAGVGLVLRLKNTDQLFRFLMLIPTLWEHWAKDSWTAFRSDDDDDDDDDDDEEEEEEEEEAEDDDHSNDEDDRDDDDDNEEEQEDNGNMQMTVICYFLSLTGPGCRCCTFPNTESNRCWADYPGKFPS